MTTKSWKPAKVLEIPEKFKDSRFVYRWVDRDRIGNVRKKLSEGWEIDSELTKKLVKLPKTLQDGSNLDSTFHIRELILMRLPKELAEARRKYYAERSGDTLSAEKEKYRRQSDGRSYGDISETA